MESKDKLKFPEIDLDELEKEKALIMKERGTEEARQRMEQAAERTDRLG